LVDSEVELRSRVAQTSPGEKGRLSQQLMQLLGISQSSIDEAVFRLLIERARSFALPGKVWRRNLDATWSVRDANREYLLSLNLVPTPERLKAMQDLYYRFVVKRRQVSVSEETLRSQNYSCIVCGLRFYNDELLGLGFESPLGNRPRPKVDPLK